MPSLVEADPSLTHEEPSRRRRRQGPSALAGLIEGEIIPRLLLAHRAAATPLEIDDVPSPAIPLWQAEAFADLVLRSEAYALMQHIDVFLARGATVETLLLDLLAPAAKRLGVYWEEDQCDFVDVTMGLWRLQEIVHELAARTPFITAARGEERRALLALVPGEQHGFGLLVIEDFFRRAGWVTTRLGSASQAEIVALVRRYPFDLIALSANCDLYIERLPGLIEAVRTASINPAIGVMAGGRVFADRPELALLLGADTTASDAREAVAAADILLEKRVRHDSSPG